MRIIADDLSGAADAGVAFVANGHGVQLMLDADDPRWHDAAGVVAVDTDTRERDGQAAAAAVGWLAASAPGDELLKKVDSTLRGHVAAELRALREVLPNNLIVFAPAFPRAGRTTRAGVQLVDGLPLHRSDAWAAEAGEPPQRVAELLPGLPVREVAPDTESLAGELGAAAARGDVAVCDAATDADLDAIVEAARSASGTIAWAGSAGLAAALARETPGGRSPTAWEPEGARYLAVLGSAAAVATEQARALRTAGTDLVELPRAILEAGDAAALERLATDLAARASRGSVAVTISGRVDRPSAVAVGASLAQVAAPAAAEAPLVALTGGATARGVLERLGVMTLDLLAEPEPGVAVARAGTRHVVTKAGGFGDAGTFVRVLHGSRAG